jgi:hypothetical protein
MGAEHPKEAVNEENVVYEEVIIDPALTTLANNSEHKPLPAYAKLTNHRPAMYPETKATLDEITESLSNYQTNSKLKG